MFRSCSLSCGTDCGLADAAFDTSIYDYVPATVKVYNSATLPGGASQTLASDRASIIYSGLPQNAVYGANLTLLGLVVSRGMHMASRGTMRQLCSRATCTT